MIIQEFDLNKIQLGSLVIIAGTDPQTQLSYHQLVDVCKPKLKNHFFYGDKELAHGSPQLLQNEANCELDKSLIIINYKTFDSANQPLIMKVCMNIRYYNSIVIMVCPVMNPWIRNNSRYIFADPSCSKNLHSNIVGLKEIISKQEFSRIAGSNPQIVLDFSKPSKMNPWSPLIHIFDTFAWNWNLPLGKAKVTMLYKYLFKTEPVKHSNELVSMKTTLFICWFLKMCNIPKDVIPNVMKYVLWFECNGMLWSWRNPIKTVANKK